MTIDAMRSRSVFVVALLSALLAVPTTASAGYLALVPDAHVSGSAGFIAGIDTDTNTRAELLINGAQPAITRG